MMKSLSQMDESMCVHKFELKREIEYGIVVLSQDNIRK